MNRFLKKEIKSYYTRANLAKERKNDYQERRKKMDAKLELLTLIKAVYLDMAKSCNPRDYRACLFIRKKVCTSLWSLCLPVREDTVVVLFTPTTKNKDELFSETGVD